MALQSDSAEQRQAEVVILAALTAQLGVVFEKKRLDLPGGSRVEIDGVADDESVLVEVFAHQGPLKGAQVHKVARDALKLITVARSRTLSPRLILVLGDDQARKSVTGRSWLSEALKIWGVETFTAELDDVARSALLAAQGRQVMINGPI